MQLNGGTPATTTYNAANQITNAGFTYDNSGNLLNDGTAATYDALNRTTARGSTTYAYNGDGTLVSQATSGVTTRYTQDLAAPLSQVLQIKVGSAAITDYLYGLNRLASLNSGVKTWYAADALGSVRRTVADNGTPQGIVNYDPWGTPETGTVPTFGFTGEVQDVGAGVVNLRARWYATGQGRFTTLDRWQGESTRPQSLNKYAYVEDDPINAVDPTGLKRFKIWASAFIEPREITFPYIYDASRFIIPHVDFSAAGFITCSTTSNGIDWTARFHGDDRTFSAGERTAGDSRSRMWHEVIIDTTSKAPLVSNERNVGRTYATYKRANGEEYTDTDLAARPESATVSKGIPIPFQAADPCCIVVEISGESGNPLVKGSPPIQYYYKLVFDLIKNELRYVGMHTPFPSHELYVSEVGSLHQFSPKAQWWGAIANPLFLAAGNTVGVPLRTVSVDMGIKQRGGRNGPN